MATCPECDIEIEIDEVDLVDMEVGDPWVCDGCASDLRVAVLDPLAFDVDDDDDDDDDKAKTDDAEADDADADDDEDDSDGDDWDE